MEPRGVTGMARCQDYVALEMPNVLRDRLRRHLLHPRMAMHEVIEEALEFWEEAAGWTPHVRAPVDGYLEEAPTLAS